MTSVVATLQPAADSLRRAWRGSPLPGFFHWWGGQLRALLPARWQHTLDSGEEWFALTYQLRVWSLTRAGESTPLVKWWQRLAPELHQQTLQQALKDIDPEDLRLVLGLPETIGLRRQLILPLAARDNLMQAVAFEIDRQTPFRAEQVYTGVRPIDAPAGEGRFAVELVAVKRSTIDPLLKALADAQIQVDAVDLLVQHQRLGVNLLPPAQRRVRRRPRQRTNLLLAAAAVLLLGLALGQWLHNRRESLAAMQAQVQAMQGQAQQVMALRQQLQDNAGAAGFLTARKKSAVPMLSLLDAMTKRLPDTAWLERFSVDGSGQIGFQGQAKQAAQLIDALKDSPLISDPGFQGSIQPDPSTGKERFYMVAKLRQPSAPKAKPVASGASGASSRADAGDGS